MKNYSQFGTPWPISLAFRPVFRKACFKDFKLAVPSTLTKLFGRSTSTTLTPDCYKCPKEEDHEYIINLQDYHTAILLCCVPTTSSLHSNFNIKARDHFGHFACMWIQQKVSPLLHFKSQSPLFDYHSMKIDHTNLLS